MEKLYCFNCQRDVRPFKFFKWRFCPDCRRYMHDDGSGFYKVCDDCGANLPADAARCIKCGYKFYGDNAVKEYDFCWFNQSWVNKLISALIVFISILAGFALVYVSFYLVLFIAAAGLVWFILNMLRIKMRL